MSPKNMRGAGKLRRETGFLSAHRQNAKVGRLESGPRTALCARQEKLGTPYQDPAGANRGGK